MNQSQHDELAMLFSQQMNFSQAVEHTSAPDIRQESKDSMPDAFVSISAHYTQTTHIRPLPYNESLMPEAMAQLLVQNSIDPGALLPNQIQLFGNAGDEQRLRLLELWRISPPTYTQEKGFTSQVPTSMQQEELLAKVRFETNMAARALAAYQQGWSRQDMDFDTHVITPIREAGETAWPPAARMRAASIAASRTIPKPGSEAEPYVVSGYQNTSSTDPVYGAVPGLWQRPSYAPAMAQHNTMEDQYGSLMQIRNHAEWEAMNERIANERLSGLDHNDSHNHDMIM